MKTPVSLETVVLLGAALIVAFVVLSTLRVWYAAKARHDKWEPAIDPQADVHVLGSDYPQDGRSFFGGMVNRAYSVPKDPIEYAKIFVPETKDKGQ